MTKLRKKSHFRWLFLALLLALLPAAVYAQAEPITDDEVNEVAQDVYCPVCESTPLDVCPTAACADWRELIRTKLSEGQSRDEILEYFARQYGDGVLANPPRRGASLVILWILPLLLVLVGLLLFSRLLRGLRRPTAAAPPPRPKSTTGDPALDDYISRVEKEVDE
ncbi:MAG: cytochrome c-type biogenesis protein CcmH [Anaerolineae bacterium]|uniref:cytochrome c-type biogenesis protein n=1 Tax=Promineifilum sp. TaxID=2664178 RepID=UPI001DCD9EB5|nr:cytochrome c-type biogenesis protein CcmH [Anaerolineales bacterium]MCB8934366.1 cytochrome c-type biogenesis protein CcmH [Promineifilum sp.]MCO5180307.1 cytochrome c-type biogenesis protein CcmH [Promineifilum sp.]MCW5847327.1 cytochrome c-type biogenesis protein CcmH [Anaerolineae bacterium]